jgi:vacuolar-type H+-ATPase subunit I/STV1
MMLVRKIARRAPLFQFASYVTHATKHKPVKTHKIKHKSEKQNQPSGKEAVDEEAEFREMLSQQEDMEREIRHLVEEDEKLEEFDEEEDERLEIIRQSEKAKEELDEFVEEEEEDVASLFPDPAHVHLDQVEKEWKKTRERESKSEYYQDIGRDNRHHHIFEPGLEEEEPEQY